MAAQNNIWASEVLKRYILKFHDNDYPGDKCYSILKCDMTIDNDHPGDKCTYHDKEMFTQLQES